MMTVSSNYEGMPLSVTTTAPGVPGISFYRLTPCYCCEAGCGKYPRETMWAIKIGEPPLCPECRGEL